MSSAPARNRTIWWLALAVALLAGAVGAYYYYFVSTHMAEPAPGATTAAMLGCVRL